MNSTNFDARQIALRRVGRFDGSHYLLMLTDTPGRLACRAIEDTDVVPGGAGYQIMISLPVSHSEHFGSECPVGEYVLVDSPSCEWLYSTGEPGRTDLYDGCVVYREWDASGDMLVSNDVARSGLVTINKTAGGCRIDTELIFDDHEPLFCAHMIMDVDADTECGFELY